MWDLFASGRSAVGVAWLRCAAAIGCFWLAGGVLHGAPGVAFLLRPENLKTLGCDPPDAHLAFVAASQPGNLFLPGEAVDLSLRATRGTGPFKAIVIQVLEIDCGTQRWLAELNEVGTARLPAVDVRGVAGRTEVPAEWDDRAGVTNVIELKNLPVPAAHGTYVVTVAPDGKQPRFLCSVARVPRPREGWFIQAPVLGEGQYLTGDRPDPESLRARALALARMGIKGVRVELAWHEPQPRRYDWRQYDHLMNALEEARIKALVTLSGHPAWALPFGEPTPAVFPQHPDRSCLPAYYEAFGRFVYEFCTRYWRDGEGPLWAVEHWNEPWEGVSVTGWGSDLRHYLELMRQLTKNARRVDPRIRTAAAGSIMNTEVKFLTGSRPEDNMRLLDLFTDQHVPPPASYGPMVARFWGKESLDTGSWIAPTEAELLQVMCQFLACGQDRVTPWHPSMVAFAAPGAPMRYQMPTPVATATAAFNAMIGGRRFQQLLNLTHLPWAFQFGEDPDAVIVLLGRLRPLSGGSLRDLPWWQLELETGGAITIENLDGALEFYDVAANRVFEGVASVRLPAEGPGWYLRCPRGGLRLLEKRLHDARLEGYRAVEIVARDFTLPLDGDAAEVRVSLHNLLNEAVTGTLKIQAPEGIELEQSERGLTLGDGETRDFQFPFRRWRVNAANAYPFEFRFESGGRVAVWREVLHDLVVRRRSIVVDGQVDDWLRIPGVLLHRDRRGTDQAEQTWLPFPAAREAGPSNLIAEVKLAYDDRFLYVAAQVNDPTPYPGHVRLARWDEDQYFRGPKDDAVCEALRPYEALILELTENPRDRTRALARPEWPQLQRVLATNAEARLAVESQSAQAYFRGRKRRPSASYTAASHVYKQAPWEDRPHAGDTLQLGLDLLAGCAHHRLVPDTDRLPEGFHAMPDTDYEFCAYPCRDGGVEVWRALAPGVPRSAHVPRQPRAVLDQGPVPGAACVVVRDGSFIVYELALPWAAMKEWSPRPGLSFGGILRINDNRGAPATLGGEKSATKSNGLSLHPYHEGKPSCGVRWTLGR